MRIELTDADMTYIDPREQRRAYAGRRYLARHDEIITRLCGRPHPEVPPSLLDEPVTETPVEEEKASPPVGWPPLPQCPVKSKEERIAEARSLFGTALLPNDLGRMIRNIRESQDPILEIPPCKGPIKIIEIQHLVASCFDISVELMRSPLRMHKYTFPRQIAMYLAKLLTQRSLLEIGRRFGGRDHTTVLHAVRKIGALIEVDAELAAEVAALKEMLS